MGQGEIICRNFSIFVAKIVNWSLHSKECYVRGHLPSLQLTRVVVNPTCVVLLSYFCLRAIFTCMLLLLFIYYLSVMYSSSHLVLSAEINLYYFIHFLLNIKQISGVWEGLVNYHLSNVL